MTIPKLTALLALAAAHALAEEAVVRPRQRIVVSLPDRKLALLEGNRLVKLYDVAVGKATTPSPAGRHQLISRVENPTWYYRGKSVPPGTANPLGTRWLGLSAKGYGIHGTNVPNSIGKAASHGCIRMRNRDVEELFPMVETGIEVELESETPRFLAQLIAVTGD